MKNLVWNRCSAALILVTSVLVAIEGTWGVGLVHHWAFRVLLALLAAFCAVAAILDLRRRAYSPLLSHVGLCLVLAGGLAGVLNRIEAQVQVYAGGSEEHFAYDADGVAVRLPFGVALQEFRIDMYDDQSTHKQYASTIAVDGKVLTTSVNHPCRHKGWLIYQSGFDRQAGEYSVLGLVHDPWLPLVALGAVLLALSAFVGLRFTWNSWKMPAVAVVLTIVFALISVARISLGTLPPALRSLWFVPHLIVYMLAYSIMALSVVAGIASLFTAKVPAELSARLLSTASSLMLIGMLCGAFWAQQAWGNYWTWDAKECWAAATWLLTLVVSHFHGRKLRLAFTVLAFISMQMTWYGVNYLPASNQSLHAYNRNS